MSRFWWLLIVLAASVLADTHEVGAAEGPSATSAKRLRVLVVAGGHGYPVKPFREVFAGHPDMDCTFVDETQGGEAFEDVSSWPYDAMVLYPELAIGRGYVGGENYGDTEHAALLWDQPQPAE